MSVLDASKPLGAALVGNSKTSSQQGCFHTSLEAFTMPPRLQYLRRGQIQPLHLHPCAAPRSQAPLCLRLAQSRPINSSQRSASGVEEKAQGPNQAQLPHISEEAAAIGDITGEGGPSIEEQGTPVQEVPNN